MKKTPFATSLVVIIILPLIVTCIRNNTITISGNVTGDTKGFNYIYYYTRDIPVDSVAISDGQFKISVPFKDSYTQFFYTQYETSGNRGYRPYPLLIENSTKIKINMNIEDGFFKAKIVGPQTTELYHSFLKQQSDVYKLINETLMKLYGKAWVPSTDPLYSKIFSSGDSLSMLYMGSFIRDFVKFYKDKFVGIFVLNESGKNVMNVDQLETSLNFISPKMQKTKEGEKLSAYIRGIKNTVIGSKIQNFILTDPNGKELSIEQLKGKYVWIDFWASWCGPCKMSFPHMIELYSRYKDMDSEILGISTDTKIEPWIQSLETLKNPCSRFGIIRILH